MAEQGLNWLQSQRTKGLLGPRYGGTQPYQGQRYLQGPQMPQAPQGFGQGQGQMPQAPGQGQMPPLQQFGGGWGPGPGGPGGWGPNAPPWTPPTGPGGGWNPPPMGPGGGEPPVPPIQPPPAHPPGLLEKAAGWNPQGWGDPAAYYSGAFSIASTPNLPQPRDLVEWQMQNNLVDLWNQYWTAPAGEDRESVRTSMEELWDALRAVEQRSSTAAPASGQPPPGGFNPLPEQPTPQPPSPGGPEMPVIPEFDPSGGADQMILDYLNWLREHPPWAGGMWGELGPGGGGEGPGAWGGTQAWDPNRYGFPDYETGMGRMQDIVEQSNLQTALPSQWAVRSMTDPLIEAQAAQTGSLLRELQRQGRETAGPGMGSANLRQQALQSLGGQTAGLMQGAQQDLFSAENERRQQSLQALLGASAGFTGQERGAAQAGYQTEQAQRYGGWATEHEGWQREMEQRRELGSGMQRDWMNYIMELLDKWFGGYLHEGEEDEEEPGTEPVTDAKDVESEWRGRRSGGQYVDPNGNIYDINGRYIGHT